MQSRSAISENGRRLKVQELSERGFGAAGWCARHTMGVLGMQVFLNHFAGCIDTASATRPDGELHLYFAQGAGTLIDSPADLPIGDAVTYANVHSETAARRE